MDIQEILEQKIRELPAGPHADGLRAVKLHIDAAVRHYKRGQSQPDETLFTDVIFRCNQAFEGSIKEAYRVLAGKDPQGVRPFDIEQFLGTSNLLRKKVLDQFSIYRRDWRNPSTHDYTLDFDEDEALIAIVSVTVFAIVLTDQIDGKIAFESAAAAAPAGAVSPNEQNQSLLELVTNQCQVFAQLHTDNVKPSSSSAHDYYRLEGALAGYLTSELSVINGVSVEQNKRLGHREADIVVIKNAEAIVIELKRIGSNASGKLALSRAVAQAAVYLQQPSITGAVVLIYSSLERKYGVESALNVPLDSLRVIVPVNHGQFK